MKKVSSKAHNTEQQISKIQLNSSALDMALAKCLRLTPRAYVKIDIVCGSLQKRVDARAHHRACAFGCAWACAYVCAVQFQVTKEKKRQDTWRVEERVAEVE